MTLLHIEPQSRKDANGYIFFRSEPRLNTLHSSLRELNRASERSEKEPCPAPLGGINWAGYLFKLSIQRDAHDFMRFSFLLTKTHLNSKRERGEPPRRQGR